MAGEAEAIAAVDEPVTVVSLVDDLRELGVTSGETVFVHSSLSAIGWVAGDAPAVVDALLEVVGEDGTIAMPTFTTQYSDPAEWERPPVPSDWIETIRRTRPPYRPALTPSRGMGAIPECFRSYPEVIRSRHPLYSVAARGANAESLVAEHQFDHGLGDGSPLAAIYDDDGMVLQLGTGHETNSSLHLAEYRSGTWSKTVACSIPILIDGKREQVDFEEVGDAFEEEVDIRRGPAGAADARLMSQRDLVDFATDWFRAHR